MSNLPILVYLIGVLVVGLAYSSRKDRSAEDYFYGGRTAGSVAFGSSLLLSNILRYQVVLLPLVALGTFWFAVGASVLIVALSYRFRWGEESGSEPLEAWGSGGGRVFASGLVFLSYATVQIAALLALSNFILKDALSLDYYTSTLLVVVFAGIYSIVGGFSAVAHTQTLQLVVVIAGLIVLAFMRAVPAPGSIVPAFTSPADFTMEGALLGLPVVSLWVWHYDRLALKQVRAPKNPHALKSGLLVAAGAAVVIGVLMMLTASAPAGGPDGPARQVLLLIGFSVLMASFAATFSGTAELATKEFFQRLRPTASDQETVLIGRLVTTAVAGLTIVMIPMVEANTSKLLHFFLIMQVSLFPPLTALYAAKTISRSAPPVGVLAMLVAGELLGILRIVLRALNPDPDAAHPLVSWYISMDHFLFAFCLFCFSLLVLYGVGAVAAIRLRAANRLT